MSEAIILHRKTTETQKSQILCLLQSEGYRIKNLIKLKHPGSYAKYCLRIGIKESNFHAVLSGDRTCSIELLERILSGIKYEVLLSTTIILQELRIGQNVDLVSYATVDEEFVSEEMELEPLTALDRSSFSLLERLLEEQKMLPESPLQDDQAGY